MPRIDLDKVTELIQEVSQEVILPHYQNLGEAQIEYKDGDPSDLVTAADKASEAALTSALLKMHTGHVVVGEEAAHADNSLLSLLSEDKPVWILDPIDGTSDFVAGQEKFYVLVALAQQSELLAGWIYHPLSQSFYLAENGSGTWHYSAEGTSQRIALPKVEDPTDGHVNFSRSYLPRPVSDQLEENFTRDGIPYTASGTCCGHEYECMLKGTYTATLYHEMNPWDHCAGVLAVREAGGVCSLESEAPFVSTSFNGGLINAATPSLWTHVHRIASASGLGHQHA